MMHTYHGCMHGRGAQHYNELDVDDIIGVLSWFSYSFPGIIARCTIRTSDNEFYFCYKIRIMVNTVLSDVEDF
jgi:hypothetical protein